MTVRYARRALSQLASVHDYLVERSPAAATKVTRSITRAIARLEELPMLGVPTDESDVRVLIESEYLFRIFYRIDGTDVFVIRILHQAQK